MPPLSNGCFHIRVISLQVLFAVTSRGCPGGTKNKVSCQQLIKHLRAVVAYFGVTSTDSLSATVTYPLHMREYTLFLTIFTICSSWNKEGIVVKANGKVCG